LDERKFPYDLLKIVKKHEAQFGLKVLQGLRISNRHIWSIPLLQILISSILATYPRQQAPNDLPEGERKKHTVQKTLKMQRRMTLLPGEFCYQSQHEPLYHSALQSFSTDPAKNSNNSTSKT